MAGRGPQTFAKRQKEQQRKEKQEEKRERRLQRSRGLLTTSDSEDTPSEEEPSGEEGQLTVDQDQNLTASS